MAVAGVRAVGCGCEGVTEEPARLGWKFKVHSYAIMAATGRRAISSGKLVRSFLVGFDDVDTGPLGMSTAVRFEHLSELLGRR